MPELGGRLYSLVHKPLGRELLARNPVFQPANLALRNACVLIDVSPLCKYQITGVDALRFLNRLVTRDVGKCPIGGMLYLTYGRVN